MNIDEQLVLTDINNSVPEATDQLLAWAVAENRSEPHTPLATDTARSPLTHHLKPHHVKLRHGRVGDRQVEEDHFDQSERIDQSERSQDFASTQVPGSTLALEFANIVADQRVVAEAYVAELLKALVCCAYGIASDDEHSRHLLKSLEQTHPALTWAKTLYRNTIDPADLNEELAQDPQAVLWANERLRSWLC